jgi:hypothetical protein
MVAATEFDKREGDIMLSRREMVGKIAAGTAAACVVGVAKPSMATARRGTTGADVAEDPAQTSAGPDFSAFRRTVVDAEAPLSAPPSWELLHPLALGSIVAHGWQVAGLTGALDGSCVLTLQNERGRAHRVHLCRNGGHPQGLVHTEQFDLVLMNGGEGDLPTDESLAQAVAEVAHVLAANERDPRHAALLTALLPQSERVQAFSGSADRRLR